MTEKTIILPPSPAGNGEAKYRLTVMVPKRRYLSYLRERWWVLLICLALAISAMVTRDTLRPDEFTSYAQIYLSGSVQLNVGSLFSEESLTYFGTQIELLKSARVQQAAFQDAGINLPPGQMNEYKLDVVQPLKTSILELRVTGPRPDVAQRFLQAIINEYLAYKKETRISTSQDVLDSLQDELTKKSADLQNEQEKWVDFQKSNNVAVLEEEGKSDGMYLSDLNLQLARARMDQEMLRHRIEEARAGTSPFLDQISANLISTNSTGLAALNTTNSPATNTLNTADSSDLNSARVQLAVLLANQDDKIRTMGQHGFDQETTRLQRLIAILEANSREQRIAELTEKLTDDEKNIAIIITSIPIWEKKVLDINDRLSQGQRLKENVEREQGYYDHLLGTLENVDLGKNVQQEQLSVLQSALAAQPEKRNLAMLIILTGIGGLFLGLAIVFAWYLLDDRFVSVGDIKDQFGESIMGLVPQIKMSRAKPQAALLETSDSRHGYVESYRHLRSALMLSSFGEARPQTLLFTSASPAEGKTTIAINLARLLAKSGLRVVLVDADIGGGGMKRILGNAEQMGMLDYLRGEADADAVIHQTEIEGLRMVPSGTHDEKSEGLFLRPRLADLIAELRQNADFIILDGAPILASDAAALLVPHADTVVLVTRPFYTHSRLVRQALDMLYQRRARHVSIILNRARADDLAGHYAVNGFASPTGNGKT